MSPDARHVARPGHISLNGADLVAEASGALYWTTERTLIVADLHLEKGSSYATRGVLLPPYDTRATLRLLTQAASRPSVERVICLGDSFHDGEAAGRLADDDAQALRALTAAKEWIWIAGNHDPAPPREVGGTVVVTDFRLGPLTFRHIAAASATAGEISGHYHPKAALYHRGRQISGRCFVEDRRRLVLPAFGAYAGGLDVADPALMRLFKPPMTVHLIARDRITSLPWAQPADYR